MKKEKYVILEHPWWLHVLTLPCEVRNLDSSPPQRLKELFDLLSLLLREKIPIVQALKLAREESESALLARTLGKTAHLLEQGAWLDEAWSGMPEIFSLSLVAVIRAGEESGQLAEVFEKVSTYLSRGLLLPQSKLSEKEALEIFFYLYSLIANHPLSTVEKLNMAGARLENTAFREKLKDMRKGAQDKKSLSAAMARVPLWFPSPLVSLVKRGEEGDSRGEILAEISQAWKKGIFLLPPRRKELAKKEKLKIELEQFFFLFALFLSAGSTVKESLEILAGAFDTPSLSNALRDLVRYFDPLEGKELAQLMKDHPSSFSPAVITLVQRAERAGNIVQTFSSILTGLQKGLFLP